MRIDLNNDEYSPSQVEALRKQQQITGQYVTVPLPSIVNPSVTDFNGDDGTYSIDVRFNQPIVVDHVASGSEVHETVVEKEEEEVEKKVDKETLAEEIKVPTSTESSEKAETESEKETLKSVPVVTSTTTTPSPTTPTTEKKDETSEDSNVNVVTVLPDNDFTFETFDAPKELGEKVIENVSNLTAESLSDKETVKEEE